MGVGDFSPGLPANPVQSDCDDSCPIPSCTVGNRTVAGRPPVDSKPVRLRQAS